MALDGDGNLLMGFGGLALVGGLKPFNLYHLGLDNGSCATPGGQPALSRQVDLAAVAAAAGYAWARRCHGPQQDSSALEQWLAAPGPAFLDVAITLDDPRRAPHIPKTPEEMASRFRAALGRAGEVRRWWHASCWQWLL